MTWLTNKSYNAIFITFMSLIYGGMYLAISDHMEFESILPPMNSANLWFWNRWIEALYGGVLHYLGWGILASTAVILILSFTSRSQKLDEYQGTILTKAVIGAGFLSIILSPLLIIGLLSEPFFAIPLILFAVTLVWCFVLVAYLTFLLIQR